MAVINNTSLSFDDVKKDIINYLGSNANTNPDKWLDTFSSGAGMTIAEVIAGLASYISFAAINSRKEAFLDTARLESSVYSMANIRGLPVSRPEAPRVVVELKNPIICPQVIGTVNGLDLVAMTPKYTESGSIVKNTYNCYIGRIESTDGTYPDGVPISDPQNYYTLSVSPDQESGQRKWYIDNDVKNISVIVHRLDKQYILKLTTSPEDLMRDEATDPDFADAVIRTTIDGINIVFGGTSTAVYKDSSTETISRPIDIFYSDTGLFIGGSSTESRGLYYSIDGKEWIKSNIEIGRFVSVQKSGSYYFASSSDLGAIYRSSDAKTWEIEISGTESNFISFNQMKSASLPQVAIDGEVKRGDVVMVCDSKSGITCYDGSSWNSAKFYRLDWTALDDNGNPTIRDNLTGNTLGIFHIEASDKVALAVGRSGENTRFYYSTSGRCWMEIPPYVIAVPPTCKFDTDTNSWNRWIDVTLKYVKDRFFLMRKDMGVFEYVDSDESYIAPYINGRGDVVLDGVNEKSYVSTLFNFTNTSVKSASLSTLTSFSASTKPGEGRNCIAGITTYGVLDFRDIVFSEENSCFLGATDAGLFYKPLNAEEWTHVPTEGDLSEKIGTDLTVSCASRVLGNELPAGNVNLIALPVSGIMGNISESIDGVTRTIDDDYFIRISSISFNSATMVNSSGTPIPEDDLDVRAVIAVVDKSDTYSAVPSLGVKKPLYNYPMRPLTSSRVGSVIDGTVRFEFDNPPVVSKDQTVVITFRGDSSVQVVAQPSGDIRCIRAPLYSVGGDTRGCGWVGIYGPGPGVYHNSVLPTIVFEGTREYTRNIKYTNLSKVADAVSVLGEENVLPSGSTYKKGTIVFASDENETGTYCFSDKSSYLTRYGDSDDLSYYDVHRADEGVVFNTSGGLIYFGRDTGRSSAVLRKIGTPANIGFPLQDGDTVSISYLSSQGRSGIVNLSEDDISLTIDNEVVGLTYMDGGVKESVEKIKAMIPGYNSSYRRLISKSDFIAHTLAARTDVFSASCYKCQYDCCTAVVPYLRGYKDADGFIQRTGYSSEANSIFNDFMEEALYKYKMIGTEVSWVPAQETKLELNIVVTIEKGVSEDNMRKEIKDFIISKLYSINGSFSIGEVADFIGGLDGTIGVHVLKPNGDYKCTLDEYLSTSMDQIQNGIRFKYDLNEPVYDEDTDFGYVNPVIRFPNDYTRVTLISGQYSGEVQDTSIGPNDLIVSYANDYSIDSLGVTITLETSSGALSEGEDNIYRIVPNTGQGGTLPQDDPHKFLPGITSDTPPSGLRAKFFRPSDSRTGQVYLRLYTNEDMSVPVGAANYSVSLIAVGNDGIERVTVSQRVKIEVTSAQ